MQMIVQLFKQFEKTLLAKSATQTELRGIGHGNKLIIRLLFFIQSTFAF